jgi:hypothetical protein
MGKKKAEPDVTLVAEICVMCGLVHRFDDVVTPEPQRYFHWGEVASETVINKRRVRRAVCIAHFEHAEHLYEVGRAALKPDEVMVGKLVAALPTALISSAMLIYLNDMYRQTIQILESGLMTQRVAPYMPGEVVFITKRTAGEA